MEPDATTVHTKESLTVDEIAAVLRYCWDHSSTEMMPEDNVVAWVVEKFAEQIDMDPNYVNGFVYGVTGRRVYE